jgi:hypothetical protein
MSFPFLKNGYLLLTSGHFPPWLGNSWAYWLANISRAAVKNLFSTSRASDSRQYRKRHRGLPLVFQEVRRITAEYVPVCLTSTLICYTARISGDDILVVGRNMVAEKTGNFSEMCWVEYPIATRDPCLAHQNSEAKAWLQNKQRVDDGTAMVLSWLDW